MFLDINKIGSEEVRFDHALKLGKLNDRADEAVFVLRARMTGEARRGSRGVQLRARLESTVRLACSRCLEPFRTELANNFFLVLVPDAVELAAGREPVDAEDVALFYTKEGKASLEEIAREQIYLNLPLKPICRSDCRGLCPGCGANRNEEVCGCSTETVDPRFAPLLEFKQRRDV